MSSAVEQANPALHAHVRTKVGMHLRHCCSMTPTSTAKMQCMQSSHLAHSAIATYYNRPQKCPLTFKPVLLEVV